MADERRKAISQIEAAAGTMWDLAREVHVHTAAELREALAYLSQAVDEAIRVGLHSDDPRCKNGDGTQPCDYDEDGVCTRCVRDRPPG